MPGGIRPSQIDILHMDDVLYEGYSLMDIAYIYTWKQESPLRLFFRVSATPPKRSVVGTEEIPCEELIIVEDEATEGPQEVPEGTTLSLEQEHMTDKKCELPAVLQEPASSGPIKGPSDDQHSNLVTVSEDNRAETDQQINKDVESTTPEEATALHAEEQALESTCTLLSTENDDKTTTGTFDAPSRSAIIPEERATSAEKPATEVVSLVQPTSPRKGERVTEPSAEVRLPTPESLSPPPLPKITISTVDKNSNKVIIQTKEMPSMVMKMSPPSDGHGDKAKKSRRKEHKDSSKRKSLEKLSISLKDIETEGPPAKKSRQGSETLSIDNKQGFDTVVEPSSPKPGPPRAATAYIGSPEPRVAPSPKGTVAVCRPLPSQTHLQTPKTPPSQQHSCTTVTRAEEDTHPLDLSVAHHRSPIPVTKKVDLAPPFPRPRGVRRFRFRQCLSRSPSRRRTKWFHQ